MNRNEDSNKESRIPQENSSKPMDSKSDVEKSPDEKTDQDFPGYPHYPAKEDIMSQDSGSHRVDAEIEDMAAGPNASGLNQRFAEGGQKASAPATAEGESDDLAAVNSKADEIGRPQNVSNEDLDTGADRSQSGS
jgi:hypothetical protein